MDVYAVGIEMPGSERTERVRDTDVESWETTYTVFMHLTYLIPMAFVPALIMWLIKRNDSPYVDDHGREVLNFQISLFLYMAVAAISIIGIPIAIFLSIGGLVAMVFGAVAAGRGEYFRYPATLRFLT